MDLGFGVGDVSREEFDGLGIYMLAGSNNI